MIPAAFEYERPASLDEALRALAANPSAKVLAGGQSLLPLLKLRLTSTDTLVDIGRLGELRGVRQAADGGLAIGALTTYAELLDSPVGRYGAFADALPAIGDVQVRNRGTIGGSIAHADPASDLPAILLAFDASVVARSASGERVIGVDELFRGTFETSLAPGEIATEIRIPGHRPHAASAYRTLEQPASGYAMVGVAVRIGRAGPGGAVDLCRVGITGVSDIAYRASAVEQAMLGTDGSASAIAAAAASAVGDRRVNSDIHADAEYRAAMAVVYTRRAIEAALARIG